MTPCYDYLPNICLLLNTSVNKTINIYGFPSLKPGDLITRRDKSVPERERIYFLIIEEGMMSNSHIPGFKLLCGEKIVEWDVNYAESYYHVVKT